MSVVSKNGDILIRYTARNRCSINGIMYFVYMNPVKGHGIEVRGRFPDIYVPMDPKGMPRTNIKAPLGSLVFGNDRMGGFYKDREHCMDSVKRERCVRLTNFEPTGVKINCPMPDILIPVHSALEAGITDYDITINSLAESEE